MAANLYSPDSTISGPPVLWLPDSHLMHVKYLTQVLAKSIHFIQCFWWVSRNGYGPQLTKITSLTFRRRKLVATVPEKNCSFKGYCLSLNSGRIFTNVFEGNKRQAISTKVKVPASAHSLGQRLLQYPPWPARRFKIADKGWQEKEMKKREFAKHRLDLSPLPVCSFSRLLLSLHNPSPTT